MTETIPFDPSRPNSPSNRKPAPPPQGEEFGEVIIGEPADTSQIDAALVARLIFDGYKLKWISAQSDDWTAFSGAANESARESEKNIGPTPQGHFTIDPSTIEYLQDSADWGKHRVWLQPLAATVDRMESCFPEVRTQMYIHGGSVKGTIGCIELNIDQDETEFFTKLAAYGANIDLEVKYTGARKTAYEAPGCPY